MFGPSFNPPFYGCHNAADSQRLSHQSQRPSQQLQHSQRPSQHSQRPLQQSQHSQHSQRPSLHLQQPSQHSQQLSQNSLQLSHHSQQPSHQSQQLSHQSQPVSDHMASIMYPMDLGIDIASVRAQIYSCQLRYQREVWNVLCRKALEGAGEGDGTNDDKNDGKKGSGGDGGSGDDGGNSKSAGGSASGGASWKKPGIWRDGDIKSANSSEDSAKRPRTSGRNIAASIAGAEETGGGRGAGGSASGDGLKKLGSQREEDLQSSNSMEGSGKRRSRTSGHDIASSTAGVDETGSGATAGGSGKGACGSASDKGADDGGSGKSAGGCGSGQGAGGSTSGGSLKKSASKRDEDLDYSNLREGSDKGGPRTSGHNIAAATAGADETGSGRGTGGSGKGTGGSGIGKGAGSSGSDPGSSKVTGGSVSRKGAHDGASGKSAGGSGSGRGTGGSSKGAGGSASGGILKKSGSKRDEELDSSNSSEGSVKRGSRTSGRDIAASITGADETGSGKGAGGSASGKGAGGSGKGADSCVSARSASGSGSSRGAGGCGWGGSVSGGSLKKPGSQREEDSIESANSGGGSANWKSRTSGRDIVASTVGADEESFTVGRPSEVDKPQPKSVEEEEEQEKSRQEEAEMSPQEEDERTSQEDSPSPEKIKNENNLSRLAARRRMSGSAALRQPKLQSQSRSHHRQQFVSRGDRWADGFSNSTGLRRQSHSGPRQLVVGFDELPMRQRQPSRRMDTVADKRCNFADDCSVDDHGEINDDDNAYCTVVEPRDNYSSETSDSSEERQSMLIRSRFVPMFCGNWTAARVAGAVRKQVRKSPKLRQQSVDSSIGCGEKMPTPSGQRVAWI